MHRAQPSPSSVSPGTPTMPYSFRPSSPPSYSGSGTMGLGSILAVPLGGGWQLLQAVEGTARRATLGSQCQAAMGRRPQRAGQSSTQLIVNASNGNPIPRVRTARTPGRPRMMPPAGLTWACCAQCTISSVASFLFTMSRTRWLPLSTATVSERVPLRAIGWGFVQRRR